MDRDELHELVMLLTGGLKSGEITISEQAATLLASLDKVRFGTDGKVDPHTVNGEVRAAALAAASIRNEREMKKVPLRDVQSEYFDILDKFFGKPFSEMRAHGVSAAQIAEQVASQVEIVQAFQSEADTANAPSGIGNPTGPTRILQRITVSPDGQHYSGTFTLDAYDTSGTRVVHIVGVIAATRITTNTTVPDLL